MKRSLKSGLISTFERILHEQSAGKRKPPETLLILAILRLAFVDFLIKKGPYAESARRFIEDDIFDRYCNLIGLDPEYVRRLFSLGRANLYGEET